MDLVKEILWKIEKEIQKSDLSDSLSQKWQVIEIKDWVANVIWLQDAMFSEIVEFENWIKWLILDLNQNTAWILILWEASEIRIWDMVKNLWRVLSIPVWDEYLWRVLNWLWTPIDWKDEINSTNFAPVEKVAPWIIDRKSVHIPLETWIKAIDSMVPIGRWQRELIIWNRQTGKTTIGIDTILNQKWKDVYCVYVAIWQKESKISRIAQTLKEKWAMDYTIIVNAPANAPAVIQYIAPYIGCTLWEYFMQQWKHALIIYDDLSKHAVAYREVSLLLRRPPWREAYPWDVFYLHSRLLERAAMLDDKNWWWSLTALPLIETMDSDVSAYIPTNVISITDWQIFLETDLFNSWIRPAINVWLSVSRVWWSAQTKIMKKIAWKLRLELATFRELASFAQFASDLDDSTQRKIEKGKRLVEILKQWNNQPIPFYKQVVLIYAGINNYLNNIDIEKIKDFEKDLYDKLDSTYEDLKLQIKEKQELNEDIQKWIEKLINELLEEYKK